MQRLLFEAGGERGGQGVGADRFLHAVGGLDVDMAGGSEADGELSSADAIPLARRTLDATTSPATGSSRGVELAGDWQGAATLTRALGPADRARKAAILCSHQNAAAKQAPLVSISVCRPVERHMSASHTSRSCCSSGSPPVITTSPPSMAFTACHTSAGVIRRDSACRSYRVRSHVYGVSHQAHDSWQRDSRTKAARRPADGPSPWNVGPKISATSSRPPAPAGEAA